MNGETYIPEKEWHQDTKEVSSIEAGLEVALRLIRSKLETKKTRPVIIFVNGLTGSGKTSFASALETKLVDGGIKGVQIETDLYQNDRFTPADFSSQKRAWEQGEQFTYHNVTNNKDEVIKQPDVIIISGGAASQNYLHVSADIQVLMMTDPLYRIGCRIFRDHIQKTDGEPNPGDFLRELAHPSEFDQDPIREFENHLSQIAEFKQNADLIVHRGDSTTPDQFEFSLGAGALLFTSTYKGVDYNFSVPISSDRLRRLKAALGIEV